MNMDAVILITAWLLTILSLLLLVPKNKIRQANVIFFFKQFMTWFFGLAVVELRFIEYPFRSFPYATRSSFDFEYFIYPALCVHFNLYYPGDKSPFRQFMHYVYFCTGITIIEVLCERYTNLIKYTNWTWYLSWITLFITFYASRKYYLWFFKEKGST